LASRGNSICPTTLFNKNGKTYMTEIIYKTASLEFKRRVAISELNQLDAQSRALKNKIETMSSCSHRPKDRLFHFDIEKLKAELAQLRAQREATKHRIGRLNKMLKNKRRLENENRMSV
jgi:cell division protein FtsB